MPSLRAAHISHATYYLGKAQSYFTNWQVNNQYDFEDWREFEKDLIHLRAAWEWVSQKSGDPVLILAYARLSWNLVDITRDHLSRVLLMLEYLRGSNSNEKIMHQAVGKLDEVLLNQIKMLSRLSEVFAQSERNVEATTIINSTIITGDNVSIHGSLRENDATDLAKSSSLEQNTGEHSVDQ